MCDRAGRARTQLARSRSWRSVPGAGRATRRTWRSMSKSGSSAQIGVPSPVGLGWTRQPSRGNGVHGRLHARPQAIEVRWAIEDRDCTERRRQERILLDPPHQRLGVAHLAVGNDDPGRLIGHLLSLPRRPATASGEVDASQEAAGQESEHGAGGHPGDDVGTVVDRARRPATRRRWWPSSTTAGPAVARPSPSTRWRRTPPSWRDRMGTTTSSVGAPESGRRRTRWAVCAGTTA